MKRNVIIISLGLLLAHGTGFAQNIPQSQVPSLVLNHFSQTFPKAYDVEWEIKNNQYRVEFEMKSSKDHEIWYDHSGKLLKHTEEIAIRKLPAAIQSSAKSKFNGYRMEDAKKITSGSEVQYSVELKSLRQEWKVFFSEAGAVLQQYAD